MRLEIYLLQVLFFLSAVRGQSITPVNGTYTLIRGNGCSPVTAVVRPPPVDDSSDSCMRVLVSDIINNMQPTVRYMDEAVPDVEMEAAIGGIAVKDGMNLDLSFACPPDGYNGFSEAAGSFCKVTNDTQLWATFTDYDTKKLHSIRVILSNTFPEVSTLEDNEEPFGTSMFHFADGVDISGASEGDELAICPDVTSSQECPELPENSNLNTKLTATSYGYFGSDLLGETLIPGNWYQDDEKQLLSGITSPSSVGGLQDFYFNGSGFFVHAYDAPDNSEDFCLWFGFCDYACEVYNYDARFFDDLGTWDITWKLSQESFDVQYSTDEPLKVRAYMGNAIDAAGIFPSIMYTNMEQTAYLGLDKIGSAEADRQPGYAFYWYTNYTIGPPPMDKLTPPALCTGMVTTETNNTASPPTESPPTESPPTESPPTESPPTESPPTISPVTSSPATDSTSATTSFSTNVATPIAALGSLTSFLWLLLF